MKLMRSESGKSDYKQQSVMALRKWWKSFFSRLQWRSWPERAGGFFTRFLDKFGFHQFFKSLWRRIVFINLLGLIIFVAGVFYLSGFRASLLTVKVQSLEEQGKILAAVISASSTARSHQDSELDLDTLLKQYPEDIEAKPQSPPQFAHIDDKRTLDPQKIAPLLQKTVQLTNTRARVYEADGSHVLDSNGFIAPGQVIRPLTPPKEVEERRKGIFSEFTKIIASWLDHNQLPRDFDVAQGNGKAYEEVTAALAGEQTKIFRVNEKDQTIVSVATPIKGADKSVIGVLLLSTQGVEIDLAVAGARQEIIRVAIVALIVNFISSIYLTGTIAGPTRGLSNAAKRVKNNIKTQHEIPNLTHRPDEIGELSGALREMTSALYARLEAIESFAADVSHELKNPLTSLKSAVETLPLAQRDEDREHLMEVILNDVSRLNRLITDISSASRLDSELAMEEKTPIDIVRLVKAITNVFNDIHRDDCTDVLLDTRQIAPGSSLIVYGHDGRLGQVFNNLLDNAISFTPDGKPVRLIIRYIDKSVEIIIEDCGPGIPEDNLEKIFARFYTDRPGDNAFRENSGLGLNISQQIVLAHKGKIRAENIYHNSDRSERKGARFIVELPATLVPRGRRRS